MLLIYINAISYPKATYSKKHNDSFAYKYFSYVNNIYHCADHYSSHIKFFIIDLEDQSSTTEENKEMMIIN